MTEFRGRSIRVCHISKEKATDFVPNLGFAKNVKEISGPSFKILLDYYCLLAFECQDLRRNTTTMGCTVHFLPISLYDRTFVDTVL